MPLGGGGRGGEKLLQQPPSHAGEFGARDTVFTAGDGRLRGQGHPTFGEGIAQECEDGIVTPRVRVVGIFRAGGDVLHAVCEEGFWGKVDAARVTRV